MTTQSLTAEFAIEQLKILCQDGDISTAFPNFDKSSYDDEDISEDDDDDDDVVVYRVSMDCIADFVEMLAKSDWESKEEFLEFYKFVGYELFTTASDPSSLKGSKWYYTSPHGLKFTPSELLTFSGYGYFALYEKAREFCPDYSPGLVEIPAQCDAESEDISVIDLIPATVAYTYDYGEYLVAHSSGFNELQIRFWCDVIYFLGGGYVGGSNNYNKTWAFMDMAQCIHNAVFLEYLFYCTEETNNDGDVYSESCISHFCQNPSTTSKILKTIALAATGDYEKLEAELEEEEIWHGSEDSFERFRDYVMEDPDWDVEEILEEIKSHDNCTDEISEIITQYESENSDDDGEEDDL